MKKEELKMPLNLQFFAEDDDKDDKGEEDLEDEKDTDTKDTGADDKDDKKDQKKNDKVSGKTFTQEQVNKMMTKEKNQGRNSVMKELGIDPKDSKMVAMVKALIESQKSDEQKDAEKKAEEETKVKEAEERAMKAEAKAEAMVLGVKSQFVDDVVALALSKMTDDSDLKTIIGEFKTKYAIWFENGSDDEEEKGKNVGKKGTGSSVKNTKKDKDNEEKGLGARLAAQRKATKSKTSYWD